MADCLRCADPMSPLEDNPPLRAHECPRCGRRFTEEPDGTLVEKWPGPLGAALYAVIFEERPQHHRHIPLIAQKLDHLDTVRLAAEIRLELAQPTQPVARILPGMVAGEQDLRAYLRLVADELDRQRPPD